MAFIHGAGLGGWIWEGMGQSLALPSLFTDLPSREGDATTRKDLTLDDYATQVIEQISNWSMGRVIIVAHSLGGVIGLKVAKQLGDRLTGFVAVSAAIPTRGRSFVATLPPAKRVLTRAAMRVAGTRPPEAAIRKGLCNDLTVAQADEVVRRFAPEAQSVYIEHTNAAPPRVPRMYVRLRNDNEFDLRLQTKMASNLDAADICDIASGHLVMIAEPLELAQVLNDFVASQVASLPPAR